MREILTLKRPVYMVSTASVAGYEESEGPIGTEIDIVGDESDTFGKATWEEAESEMQRLALSGALSLGQIRRKDLDMIFAGDLLNQCIGSAYGLIEFDSPFIGLFGACSTAAEGLLLASLLCSTHIETASIVVSSHNASAERQFRYPLGYGGQRAPTSQWTVTGSGAFVLSSNKDRALNASSAPYIVTVADVFPGATVDAGITDANNMGAAMAPAAADTICRYFNTGGKRPDLVLTGDLGAEGVKILRDLTRNHGYDIEPYHADCGLIIFDRETQDKHAGGSGCGCSAVVLSANILKLMESGKLTDVLFVGTGALMNAMSLQHGLSIPGIAHLVHLKAVRKENL